MSECVVRMEMPENCLKCPLHEFGGVCLLKVEHTAEEWLNIDKRRPLNCPIICSLPKGHGELLESKEITVNVTIKGKKCSADVYATTIVPAERSDT